MSVATGNGIIFKKVYNFPKKERISAGAECVAERDLCKKGK